MDHPVTTKSDRRPSVAVLTVSYNSRADLPDCLQSVLSSDDGELDRHVMVVDNASIDGSADWLADNHPEVDLVKNPTNTGFTGGNNLGWRLIQQRHPDVDYLVLLNPDTVVHSGWLKPLTEYLQAHPKVGSVQPKILLHQRTDPKGRPLINTIGNQSHYLGFGFVVGYEEPDAGQHDAPRSIDYASGAAVMLRADLLKEVGLFDEPFFMYLEDVDLSWKLRAVGYDSMYVPTSVVEHKYRPDKTIQFYYHLEFNRWMLIFSYYKRRTLALIAPMIVLMEIGTLWFAWRNGLLRRKLRAYRDFFWRSEKRRYGLKELSFKRRWMQTNRTVNDRDTMGRFSGRINFAQVNRGLMRFAANPILATWWWLARRLIRW